MGNHEDTDDLSSRSTTPGETTPSLSASRQHKHQLHSNANAATTKCLVNQQDKPKCPSQDSKEDTSYFFNQHVVPLEDVVVTHSEQM